MQNESLTCKVAVNESRNARKNKQFLKWLGHVERLGEVRMNRFLGAYASWNWEKKG